MCLSLTYYVALHEYTVPKMYLYVNVSVYLSYSFYYVFPLSTMSFLFLLGLCQLCLC